MITHHLKTTTFCAFQGVEKDYKIHTTKHDVLVVVGDGDPHLQLCKTVQNVISQLCDLLILHQISVYSNKLKDEKLFWDFSSTLACADCV